MKKKRNVRILTRTASALLVLVMAGSLTACGSKKEEQQQAAQEIVEEAAEQNAQEATALTDQLQLEGAQEEAQEEVKEEVKEEAAAETSAKEPEKPDVQETPVKPDATAEPEAEEIKKPEPTGEPEETSETTETSEKEESKKKKKAKKEASADGLSLLDGKMTFDGMELAFPIELDEMKLGNWKIEYVKVDDPESKVLAPSEVVLATMTNDAYSTDDVSVTAEFGNYSNEEMKLTDLPMTGIYIAKEKGKDGEEPKLPEVIMPGGLTWGSTEAEIRELFGEASFGTGTVDRDFDFMYENMEYLVEFGGMNDTGLEYMVYCVE